MNTTNGTNFIAGTIPLRQQSTRSTLPWVLSWSASCVSMSARLVSAPSLKLSSWSEEENESTTLRWEESPS